MKWMLFWLILKKDLAQARFNDLKESRNVLHKMLLEW